MSPQPPVFVIVPTVQQYDWGKIGLSSKVAQFAQAPVDESAPYAELWMGTHTKSPSTISLTGQKLSDALTAHPDLIGAAVTGKFDVKGGNLPFLFKVLAIEKALSIQSHPDKETAAKLHAEKPDVYKDPNHKPEMALAITPFTALCGFRPLADIARYLACTPELAQFTTITRETLSGFASDDSPGAKAALRTAFEDVVSAKESSFKPALEALIARYTSGDVHPDEEGIKLLVLDLHEQFPGDIGVFCVFFLNIAHLAPGEAIFLGAGEPHAYVSGDIIECMANSDNVIRAGLTPKLRDVPILVSTLTYTAAPWSKHRVTPTAFRTTAHSALYDPPIPEFSVVRTTLSAGEQERHPAVAGPSIAIFTDGGGRVAWKDGSLEAVRGTVVFVGAGTPIDITAGDKSTVLFRAFVEA